MVNFEPGRQPAEVGGNEQEFISASPSFQGEPTMTDPPISVQWRDATDETSPGNYSEPTPAADNRMSIYLANLWRADRTSGRISFPLAGAKLNDF